jgi:soluble lytic murein transglycosylase
MRATFSGLTILFLLTVPSSALAGNDSPQAVTVACESAEGCFQAALVLSEPTASTRDQLLSKIGRLRTVQERHPGSIWAKRAGLLSGILLSEREPEEAIRFLKSAQRDWPLLDDYIRFWIGEALLKIGDPSPAAAWFESVSEAVPDTLLMTRALFRSGEAWAQAGQCQKTIDPLSRAASLGPQEAIAPTALLKLADCQFRENRAVEGLNTLKQIWVRYPNSPEARDAATRLSTKNNGEGWRPTPDEVYARGMSFSTLALHAEAMEEFQKFLVMAPNHPRRDEVRFKIGIALVRLKRYDQARTTFHALASGQSKEATDAVVWLARIYLRLDIGDRLLALPQSVTKLTLSPEQMAAVRILGGTWLEDQQQYDQALIEYRKVAQNGAGQRVEALWRIGWVQYRSGRFPEALDTFQEILAEKEDSQFTPQVLYWTGRTYERLKDARAAGFYLQVCQQYRFTYYCQLARSDGGQQIPVPLSTSLSSTASLQSMEGKPDLARDRRYLKAFELKLLGMDQEAAKELSTLIERYARDRASLIGLSALLSDVGAHHQALRLVRLHFKDSLEQGGEDVPPTVWSAAYPTAYLPIIRTHAGSLVDPFLAAAIIREESQYDVRALSRVGAVGLMQVMPATAQTVARKLGVAHVTRDDLFDQEINIRVGVRYLEQLLQQYGGNVIYAVAAYNAGPPAVAGWIMEHGEKEPDEFVELIPYQETRQYVKRVLRSYREYFRLAGASCGAPSLDKVC